MTPSPAYLKILRAISDDAVTMRVTSVMPKPVCDDTSRVVRRTSTMSPSVFMAISPCNVSVMAGSRFGLVHHVERPVHIQRGFNVAKGQPDLGCGHRHGRLHARNNRAPAHE